MIMKGVSFSAISVSLLVILLVVRCQAETLPSVCKKWETTQTQCHCHSCDCQTCYNDVCYSSVFTCAHGSCSTCWHPYFCCHRSSGTPCNCKQCCSTCNRWSCTLKAVYAVHSIQGGRMLPATGGGQVVVNGVQFVNTHNNIRCKFGSKLSEEPGTFLSDSSISCTAPPHIKQVNVPLFISLDGGIHWTLENSTATVTFYQCPNDCSGKGTCQETAECVCCKFRIPLQLPRASLEDSQARRI